MEKIHKIEESKKGVHFVLAYSYMVYLFAFIFGLLMSTAFPFKFIKSNFIINISSIVLLLSSILILWAQKSSKKFKKEDLNKKSFMQGPYRFLRNPTNLGLFLSIVSFGVIVNSIFIVIFTLIACLFSRFVFIKKEENILEKKYGHPYLEYKKTVRF